jgi:uncharacterized membrane protein
MKSGSLINQYILLLSIFLLAQGIWGLFSETVFALLTTNLNHAIIHISLGITGIILSIRRRAYQFSIFVGIVLLIAGILYLVPATTSLMAGLLNLNNMGAVVNVLAGSFALLAAAADDVYIIEKTKG